MLIVEVALIGRYGDVMDGGEGRGTRGAGEVGGEGESMLEEVEKSEEGDVF